MTHYHISPGMRKNKILKIYDFEKTFGRRYDNILGKRGGMIFFETFVGTISMSFLKNCLKNNQTVPEWEVSKVKSFLWDIQ